MHHLNVSCTGCRRQLRLPSDVVGKTVRCPLCKADFLAVEDGKGGAQVVPLAQAAGAAPPRPRPAAEDDDIPEAPLAGPLSLSLDEEDIPEAPLAPPEPPPRSRPERPEPPRPAPRKDVPAAAKFRPVRFVVFVQKDPADKLEGRFQAEVDHEGLRFWRGSGRVIAVPRGSEVRRVRGSRLAVDVEGRLVEMTVITDREADQLAAQVAAFLSGEADTVKTTEANPWPVAPLYLLPVGVPILAATLGDNMAGTLGIVLWSVLALLLLGVGFVFAFQRRWSGLARAGLALLLALFGYAALGIGFAVDRAMGPSRVPAASWAAFSRPAEGFAAQFPGTPKQEGAGHADFKQGSATKYVVYVDKLRARFTVLAAEYADPTAMDARQRMDQAMRSHLDHGVMHGGSPGRASFIPPPAPGIEAQEFHKEGPDGSWSRARLYVSRHRLLMVSAGSMRAKDTHPDFAQFWNGFKFVPFKEGGKVDPGKKDDRDLGPGGLRLSETEEGVVLAGLDPSGRAVLAKVAGGLVRVGLDGEDRQEIRDGRAVRALGATATEDRRKLAMRASDMRSFLEFDLSRRETPILSVPRPASALGYSPDGARIALGSEEGRVALWMPGGDAPLSSFASGTGTVHSIAYAPDGTHLAVASQDRTIRLHDVRTGAVVRAFKGHLAGMGGFPVLLSLAWSRDGRTLASAGRDSTVRIWRADRDEPLHSFRFPREATAVEFHPAGRIVAAGSGDGTISLWDAESGQERGSFKRDGPILSLAFTTDGNRLLVLAGTRAERWDTDRIASLRGQDRIPLPFLGIPKPAEPQTLRDTLALAGNAQRFAASADGSRFAVAVAGDRLRFFAGDPPREAASVPLDAAPLRGFAFSPDGTTFALGKSGRTALLDPADGRTRSTLTHPAAFPPTLFLGNGKMVSGAGRSGTKTGNKRPVYDLATGAESSEWAVTGVVLAVSADGKRAATTPSMLTGETVSLREVEGGEVRSFKAKAARGAFTPDGKRLLIVESDGGGKLYDTATGDLLADLPGEGRPGARRAGAHVAIAPDGRTAATALMEDGAEVRVWDLPSGKRLGGFKPAARVIGLGFGPGGKTLVLASGRSLERHDLTKLPGWADRPATAKKDEGDLKEYARVEPHTAAVIDVKGGHAFLFTPDRLLLHYSYPGFVLKSAAWTGRLVKHASFDAKGKRIAAAVADPRTGEGPLCLFDIAPALDGKDLPPRLAPKDELPAKGRFRGLAAGGKWLFALDNTGVIRRFDLDTLEEAPGRGASRPVHRAIALGHGQLYAISKGVIEHFDPDTFVATGAPSTRGDAETLWAGEEKAVPAGSGFASVFVHGGMFGSAHQRKAEGVTRAWAHGSRLYAVAGKAVIAFDLTAEEDAPPVARSAEAAFGGDVLFPPDGELALARSGVVLRVTGGREGALPARPLP
ncbi:MAG: WD40 repeat domain-containing protein, partial [Gemmataceae bacterium]|nr:WD40 repeat domain-containing protein [Gemmataceae bacterium]